MGSFPGHVLPGCFFITFGLWWWIHILALILKAQVRFLNLRDLRRTNSVEFDLDYRSTTWLKIPVPCLRALPVEPSLKVIATAVGIIAELSKANWSLINRDGNFSSLNNFAHVTMYAIFLFAAVIEILRFYGILFLPPSTEHTLNSLAFFVVGELFYFHIDGRSVLDQKLHVLIYIVAFSVAIVMLLEAWQRKSFILFLARTILVVLLGTWFIQVGHVLYGAHPWKDTPSNRAFVVIAFSWHILGVLFLCLSSLLVPSLFIRLSRWSCAISQAVKGGMTQDKTELSSLIITEHVDEDSTQME